MSNSKRIKQQLYALLVTGSVCVAYAGPVEASSDTVADRLSGANRAFGQGLSGLLDALSEHSPLEGAPTLDAMFEALSTGTSGAYESAGQTAFKPVIVTHSSRGTALITEVQLLQSGGVQSGGRGVRVTSKTAENRPYRSAEVMVHPADATQGRGGYGHLEVTDVGDGTRDRASYADLGHGVFVVKQRREHLGEGAREPEETHHLVQLGSDRMLNISPQLFGSLHAAIVAQQHTLTVSNGQALIGDSQSGQSEELARALQTMGAQPTTTSRTHNESVGSGKLITWAPAPSKLTRYAPRLRSSKAHMKAQH